ncbi:hypothetical protein D3C73_1299160 [compost metagenome]
MLRAKRRMERSFEVNPPSLNTGWLNRFVVTMGVFSPVSANAALKFFRMRSRSDAVASKGTRSLSWNVMP